MGQEPQLAPPIPQAFAQVEEIQGGQQRAAMMGVTPPSDLSGGGIASRITETLSNVADDLLGRGDKGNSQGESGRGRAALGALPVRRPPKPCPPDLKARGRTFA